MIAISNMWKPKSCAECEFEVIDTSGYPRCVIMQEMVVDGNLFNRCPLEEIDIVRCGECMHLKADGTCNMFADDNIRPSVSDFCSYGERRE